MLELQLLPLWQETGILLRNRTVKPPPARPQKGTNQDVKAMVQDMVKSTLTQLGEVIPQETPTQPQS